MPSVLKQLNSPWGVALLLSLVCSLLYFFCPESLLAFRRAQITDGQYYRLFTGNLLHTNHWHLLMNLAGFWVILSVFRMPLKFFTTLILIVMLCIMEGLGLYWFYPALAGYVGLSGVLHGLFAFAAVREIFIGIRMGWLLLLGVLLKVGYEQFTGGSADVANLIGAKVAVESHLVGMVAGILLGIIYCSFIKVIKANKSR